MYFCTGLIYVVDSADRDRISESREELFGILENDEMRGVPVVIIANQQDRPSEYYRVMYKEQTCYIPYTLYSLYRYIYINLYCEC